jgi:hypothetical protein
MPLEGHTGLWPHAVRNRTRPQAPWLIRPWLGSKRRRADSHRSTLHTRTPRRLRLVVVRGAKRQGQADFARCAPSCFAAGAGWCVASVLPGLASRLPICGQRIGCSGGWRHLACEQERTDQRRRVLALCWRETARRRTWFLGARPLLGGAVFLAWRRALRGAPDDGQQPAAAFAGRLMRHDGVYRAVGARFPILCQELSRLPGCGGDRRV